MKKEDKWAIFLMDKFQLLRVFQKAKRTNEFVEKMYPRQNQKEQLKLLWGKRLLIIIGLLGMAVLAWIYCFTNKPKSELFDKGGLVKRQQQDTTLTVTVEGDDGKEVWKKDISIDVKKRKFTEEEKKRLSEEVKKYLDAAVPGENSSLMQVKYPINFVATMPQSEVTIDWSWEEEYITEQGEIRKTNIAKEGVDTEILAEASCRNWKEKYYFKVHLLPWDFTKEELAIKEVKQAVKETLSEKATEAVVALPDKVGEMKVSYTVEEEKSYLFVYMIFVIILVMPFLWQEQQKKKLKEREEQLLLDHSGVVNKTMLLLSAGLTVRKAMERLAYEYEEGRKKGEPIRYVYEEICIMVQEMRDGASESMALERFGKRCKLMPYLRFSAIITQNLKKGAGGILEILENEALEALEQRKNHALQLGEKAGTKLLFPMILMLGLVMGIIMIPAFLTM